MSDPMRDNGVGQPASAPRRRFVQAWPWLKFALGLGLLALLGWLVDWRRTIEILLGSNPGLVVLAGAILVLGIVVSTMKWSRLMRVVCGPLDFWPLLRAYWIGTFLNNYLPSSVGGDLMRIVVLAPMAPAAPLAASVLVERLTGAAALSVLSAACLSLHAPAPVELAVALWLLIGAIAGGLAAIWAGGTSLLGAGARLLARAPGVVLRLVGKVTRVGDAVAAYRRSPGELAVAFLWSLVFYGILVLFQFTLLRAVGSTIGLREAAIVAPLVPLVAMLPVTANGLGLAEGAFVLFYTQMGVPADQAFAAALLRRLVTIGMSLPGCAMWLGVGRGAPSGRALEEPT